MSPLAELRERLRIASPPLIEAIFDHLAPALFDNSLVDSSVQNRNSSKDFNDPIWKLIRLDPIHVGLVSLPLLQRLRRVRQLGLAYLVYPSAHHSRLEHSIGAMHAARLMFERLSARSSISEEHRNRFENVVALAALLHDIGHSAFSHLSERVIGANGLFYDHFPQVLEVLDSCYSDPLKFDEAFRANRASRKPPPAAEILSALFVLSPPMETFLSGYDPPFNQKDTILMICGLILGRPYNLNINNIYYHYVKNIVSGDIDADKIDYVARDAYFAGMPISADIGRLLSQLTPAILDDTTEFDGNKPPLGGQHPDRYELMGIRPPGVAALEMFVLTRSYLYDRIYHHQKVRTAEAFLERLLRQQLMYCVQVNGWVVTDVLGFLFNPAGDDAVLAAIADHNPERDPEGIFATMANKILRRKLPERALALAPRFLADYVEEAYDLQSEVFTPWNTTKEDLSQHPEKLEDRICKLTGIERGSTVYVDFRAQNTIKEDPDIWVSDPMERNRLVRINKHFDPEQLSNAYVAQKEVAWIFCDSTDKTKVAAAAAFALHDEYDLLVGREAVLRGKVFPDEYQNVLSNLKQYVGKDKAVIIANLLERSADRRIIVPRNFHIMPALQALEEAERNEAAARLIRQLTEVRLSRSFYRGFGTALEILRILLRHCVTYNRHEKFRHNIPGDNEKRFQRELLDFLRSNETLTAGFRFDDRPWISGGESDIVFTTKDGRTRFVVELKSKRQGYKSLYRQHGGQPATYASAGLARVSFLYCQFKAKAPVYIGDTLQVRHLEDSGSRHAIICIGQQAFWDIPSKMGRTSVPVNGPL